LILIKEAMNSGGDRVMVPDMAYSVLMQAFKKIDNYKAAGPMEFEVVKLLGHEGYYLRPVGKVGVVGRIQYVDDKVPEEYRGDD
jgi:hypothetical protein